MHWGQEENEWITTFPTSHPKTGGCMSSDFEMLIAGPDLVTQTRRRFPSSVSNSV